VRCDHFAHQWDITWPQCPQHYLRRDSLRQWCDRNAAIGASAITRVVHVACWVSDLDATASWWKSTFGAEVGGVYTSRNRPGFTSRHAVLGDGLCVELMAGPWVKSTEEAERAGWAHVAIGVGSMEEVDRIAEAQRALGCLRSGPRWPGDRCYEAVLQSPDGILVEITP
jgi:lactoylglutathione lyase